MSSDNHDRQIIVSGVVFIAGMCMTGAYYSESIASRIGCVMMLAACVSVVNSLSANTEKSESWKNRVNRAGNRPSMNLI